MSLIRNSLWNFSGYIIPAIVTIPALGILGRILGPERFGVFTLALAVVGYASIFDVGLTRAVIREVAIFKNNLNEKLKIISSASFIVGVLGTVACLFLISLSDQLTNLLKIDQNLHSDVVTSLKIVAISVPMFLITQIWLAILEGEERFAILNVYKTITGTLISIIPAGAVLINASLSAAIIGLVISRFISLLVAFYLTRNIVISAGISLSRPTVKRLFLFGGWITVSNIISPVMAYFDRFIVSNQLGAGVVAFYTAPAEIISRLGIIPGAFARAVFPRLSSTLDVSDRKKSKQLISILLLLSCVPVTLVGYIFSEQIMVLWMGKAYSGLPGQVLSVLLVGFIFNSMAQVPFSNIQARGYAKFTALIHLIELIPYLVAIFFLINTAGLLGAAWAWTARMIIDTLLLYGVDHWLEKKKV